MKKFVDKQLVFCKKCKSKQKFEVSKISEYDEPYGICDRYCHCQKFNS